MLHIVAKKLDDCLLTTQAGDIIILIEDAIYQVETALAHTETLTIYALIEDIIARGWQDKSAALPQVDYAGFVKLTIQHHPIINW